MISAARASAPASIGNIGVGYDVLGQAFDAVRDTVTAWREDAPGVRLGAVSGLLSALPAEPQNNTALRAAAAVLDAAGASFGVRLDVHKGVPLSAGMGGSAASAVAAAAAVNALLDAPYATQDLMAFALEGERASADPPLVRSMPAPQGVTAILFHPDARTETQAARDVLKPETPLETAVEHARRISAFTLGCALSDLELIKAGLDDILIEPQRAFLLPELVDVKAAALNAGALGCSFSGSGPSVFAWAEDARARAVQDAMADAFVAAGRSARVYHAPLQSDGVRLEPMQEQRACG